MPDLSSVEGMFCRIEFAHVGIIEEQAVARLYLPIKPYSTCIWLNTTDLLHGPADPIGHAPIKSLPMIRYDTSYFEYRQVARDDYIDARGNRYNVPSVLVKQRVAVRIGLDDLLHIFWAGQLVAGHQLKSRQAGWNTIPEHLAEMWQSTRHVEQRSLAVYEEVA